MFPVSLEHPMEWDRVAGAKQPKLLPPLLLPAGRCEEPSHAEGKLQTEMCQAVLYLLQTQHS